MSAVGELQHTIDGVIYSITVQEAGAGFTAQWKCQCDFPSQSIGSMPSIDGVIVLAKLSIRSHHYTKHVNPGGKVEPHLLIGIRA